MANYTVTLKETVFYTVEVEADDEDDARDQAVDLWASSEDPTNDYCGMGQGVEVDDVEAA